MQYMREILGARFDEFLQAYANKPRHKALRVNTKKIGANEFAKMFGGELRPNALCDR